MKELYLKAIQMLANVRTMETLRSEISAMEGQNTRLYSEIHAAGIHTGQGTINGQGTLKHFAVIKNVRYTFETEEGMLIFLCEHFMTENA